MKDDEDSDLWMEPAPVLDEDSGSAFELSESEQSTSSKKKKKTPPASSSRRPGSKSHLKLSTRKSHDDTAPDLGVGEETGSSHHPSLEVDEPTREEAKQQTGGSQGPPSPSDIINPERYSRKRRQEETASYARAKRVKNFNNAEYRDLLNSDIHDAATGILHEDDTLLPPSQIGAIIWTSQEKELFFYALSRLGRDDIRGIAKRIGTKSEVEVHEYIRLLHEGAVQRMGRDTQNFLFTEIPAAMEISEECCTLLEHAGDAQASRQELQEEEKEKAKWKDRWLVTEAVSCQLGPFKDEESDEEASDGVPPAAKLFNSQRWLDLSNRIFMNSAAPYEEDNWQNLAEDGEMPAIRATAFEDFHSLTVSITKRIVSTVLFCTMSRLRAISSTGKIHSHIHRKDVEAALSILRLQTDTHEYWRKCARRCHLQVVDDEWPGEDGNTTMTYDEVEEALQARARSRSRSRSVSQSASNSMHPTPVPSPSPSTSSDSEVMDSDNESILDIYDNVDFGTPGAPDTPIPTPRGADSKRKLARMIAEGAQDNYLDTLDLRESREEESRLWTLLGETPPFDIKPELPEDPGKPPKSRNKLDYEGDWREYTEFFSEWETYETPVPEENFEMNKQKMERRRGRKRGLRRGANESAGSDSGESDAEANEVAEQDVEQGEVEGYENEVEDEEEDERMVDIDDIGDSPGDTPTPSQSRYALRSDRISHPSDSSPVSRASGDEINIKIEH